MDDITENNVIQFKNITQKKNGIFANFKAKALKNGVTISASISVDISAQELHPGDTMEKIIEQCARIASKEVKKIDFSYEGTNNPSNSDLGVAQLG